MEEQLTEGAHNLKHQLHEQKLMFKIQGINSRIDALIEMHERDAKNAAENFDKLIEQTTLTNGRVTKLEKQTIVWRWLTEKPVRIFVLLLVLKILGDIGLWEKLADLWQ
jgi:hypothetical protein